MSNVIKHNNNIIIKYSIYIFLFNNVKNIVTTKRQSNAMQHMAINKYNNKIFNKHQNNTNIIIKHSIYIFSLNNV